MNPLLDLLSVEHIDAAKFADTLEALPKNEHTQKLMQQALHRCISKGHTEAYACILPHFLPQRAGCGSLLNILVEKERPEMFVCTWKLLEQHDKFHPQMVHIYGQLLREMADWTDLGCIQMLLTSPIVGRMKLNEYTGILNDVFSVAVRYNNTALFVYLLDHVDHKHVDYFVYHPLIENHNTEALIAALPYMAQSLHPEYCVEFAWREALKTTQFDIFELLMPLSNAYTVGALLKGDERDAFEMYTARKQATAIEQHIAHSNLNTAARKI